MRHVKHVPCSSHQVVQAEVHCCNCAPCYLRSLCDCCALLQHLCINLPLLLPSCQEHAQVVAQAPCNLDPQLALLILSPFLCTCVC